MACALSNEKQARHIWKVCSADRIYFSMVLINWTSHSFNVVFLLVHLVQTRQI